ncbi:helix-turn-helix domain-containing protein [Halobacteriaceae archaeon GCM10025711]
MADNQKKLEDLIVDEDELNEELLAGLLSNYVRIGNDSGRLVLQPAFHELTSDKQVAVVLLSQKAKTELDMAESEWLTPSDIAELSGVKKGTVYPAVRNLDDEGLAENDDGNYRIPTYNLEKTEQFIKEDK